MSIIRCRAVVKGNALRGNVTFSQVGGTGSVSYYPPDPCILAETGVCNVKVEGARAGTAMVQATYSGDSKNSGSTSNTVGLTVRMTSVKLLVKCSPNPVKINQSTSCTATVTGFYPTGKIGWLVSGGTGHLTPTSQNCTLATVAPPSAGIARCTVSFKGTVLGKIKLEVTYWGDLNNAEKTIKVSQRIVE